LGESLWNTQAEVARAYLRERLQERADLPLATKALLGFGRKPA